MLVFATMVAVGTLLSTVYISKSITRPIEKLAENMTEFSKTNKISNKKLINTNIKEIYELKENFENMAKKVENTIEVQNEYVEKLKQIDRKKAEFSSMVSHELKTPLFPIKFQTKTLLEGIYGKINDEQKNSLEEINSNCMKLERLILNLLNIQKNNLEGTPFDLQNIDLKKFMNEAYLENKTFFENSGIEFTNETSDTIFFRSDPHKLKQIFRNLITNSIDFVSDKNGKIQISATHENNSITFLVKDNGVGIAKKDLDNIFKKFHKVNTSITRKYGGAGLGLSICKQIIESLNGKISIQSTLGKDTTVYFQIPFENSNLKIQNPEGVKN
ncbi:MAG: ATP-binding protein [Nitrosopumilus sp.]